MKYLKTFKESIVGGSLPDVTYYNGVNFGKSGNVRSTFGEKPTLVKKQPDSSGLGFTFSGDGEFMDENDVKKLLLDYDVWCKQNSQEVMPINEITPELLAKIKEIISQ